MAVKGTEVMAPFLPEELRTKVKERLRDARFVAREMRATTRKGQDDQSPERSDRAAGPAGLVTAIADFSDSALSALESVAIGLLSSDPNAHFGSASAYPLGRYFDTENATSQALFARDCYFAAKQILLAKGVANPRLSEELFGEAHRLAARTEQPAPAGRSKGADDASLDDIALQAAAMAHAILRARPVESPRYIDDAANGRMLDTGIYVAAALALATAVASYSADVTADDDIYAGVCAAVDARYVLFSKALASQDRPGDLARVFADLIPHLP
ncbi:hypothetical protein EN780_23230 [Mesorhizobium sp. M4B.F.Ca.ET.089.01.1.1]|uniref:hypothetical protein n=1 Tax=Mesorhizobium sp. M4B.F.Ca.ET.089.01.1.1 TaxID=2496662 RepID=UPI000FE2F0E2|nr:hypothetical protein [Mesorhizobium sp. M4B.F.Ca.ET.089.01.1.1]RWX63602.1 hypothetical protein EN780_23230 [Mesorhizobium sp. M4B.F.Ca.ET.089.01.1.1]